MAPIQNIFGSLLWDFLNAGEGKRGSVIASRLAIIFLLIIVPLIVQYKYRKQLSNNYSKLIVSLDLLLSILAMFFLFAIYIINHAFDKGINFY